MRRRVRAVVVWSLLAAAIVTGCTGARTSREAADLDEGKRLFSEKCGSCHVMADAGTRGQLGPNLDNALGYPRKQKIAESTLYEITLDQMRIPAPPMPDFDDPDSKSRLTEDQLVSVADYVARCAGVQFMKKRPPSCTGPAEGAQAVFVQSCGGCHALAEAGTKGTTGPSLDESRTSLNEAIAQIRNGGGGMPAFKGELSDKQIREIAQYIIESRSG